MFRSKKSMQQHSKEHPENSLNPFAMRPIISHNDHEAQPTLFSSHSQSLTLGQSHEKSHHLPYIPYTSYRPSFISNIPENNPSTSCSRHVQPPNPIVNQSSSLSEPTPPNPIMNQSSSLSEPNPFDPDLNHEHEQLYEKEMKLLTEVEIIDQQGRLLRIEKLSVKDVIRLKEGEKVLVPVNEFNQLLKAAGGVCARYMTVLLRRPNLCPREAKDWREVKTRCGVALIEELRRKFSLPQSEGVDKVLFAMFDVKYRALKYRFKQNLFGSVAKRLNEADNIGEEGAQERDYTEDQILQALEIVDIPENFVGHQWELYKSRLRTSTSKKMSRCGKKARGDQVHIHTTGAVSFARKKDEFKLINKRQPYDVEFFNIVYQMKNGSYVEDSSREFMDRARQEISKKVLEIDSSEPIASDQQSKIERDVMRELMGPDKPGRACGHGAGVTKSQVTDLSYDLRRMRSEYSTNQSQVHTLMAQVESQNRQIESQNNKIESQNNQINTLISTVNDFRGELNIFNKVFKNMYPTGTNMDTFLTTLAVSREGVSGDSVSDTQLSSGGSREYSSNAIQRKRDSHGAFRFESSSKGIHDLM